VVSDNILLFSVLSGRTQVVGCISAVTVDATTSHCVAASRLL